MLAMPQMRVASITTNCDDPSQRKIVYEGSSSPRELLESCVIQARAALRGLSAMSGVKVEQHVDSEEAKRLNKKEAEAVAYEQSLEKPTNENLQLECFW